MTDIFLSYRRESGSEFCSFLREILETEEYNVFFDRFSMRQGAFDDQINHAVAECSFLLLILAPHDLDRCLSDPDHDWILHEVGIAKKHGKVIIPVQIREGFSFPEPRGNTILEYISRQQICDVSGPDAATLVRTRLFQFMNESPVTKLRDEYLKGQIDPTFLNWQRLTLKGIYHDCNLLQLFATEYPAVSYLGSRSVKFPFDSINNPENLLGLPEPYKWEDLPIYRDYRRIIRPTVHFPDLYGYTNAGLIIDDERRVGGFKAIPRTYKETVYTSHILKFELWCAFQKLGPTRFASLEDLPIRNKIHLGQKSNEDVLISGENRSSLAGICMAVMAYNTTEKCYSIAIATRSTKVASYPRYLSIVPSGGFELYEQETMQDMVNIRRNFKIHAALYREYIEELFGDEGFAQATGDDDLNRLFRNKHIRKLVEQINEGKISFEFLGVTIDLTTLQPLFSFALKIDDPHFLEENDIRKNSENTDLRFVSLNDFESIILERENTAPLMPESAGLYSLLMQNHLYDEAKNYMPRR